MHAHADRLPGGAALDTFADQWLRPDERARYERFRHDRDRRMFLLGRVLARQIVGQALGCRPREWTWREGPRGRPEIADDHASLRFNLAHSGGLVVCALARDRDVGVDVESTTRRAPEAAIVDRYCAPSEVADIRTHDRDWPTRFLEYWTLKEAYLKARGLGIAVPLHDIAFDLTTPAHPRIAFLDSLTGQDDRWAFTLARPTAEHIVAVATHTPDGARPAVTVRAWNAEP
ncbi:MAG TPA: 4'-phosphopantetheinyl transferase superfamily protein [Vicinamibacterales bacterium]|nr:4'-phosphopantetheinyl transferase superfamily protein [Vicinamibacterales bacterium]